MYICWLFTANSMNCFMFILHSISCLTDHPVCMNSWSCLFCLYVGWEHLRLLSPMWGLIKRQGPRWWGEWHLSPGWSICLTVQDRGFNQGPEARNSELLPTYLTGLLDNTFPAHCTNIATYFNMFYFSGYFSSLIWIYLHFPGTSLTWLFGRI